MVSRWRRPPEELEALERAETEREAAWPPGCRGIARLLVLAARSADSPLFLDGYGRDFVRWELWPRVQALVGNPRGMVAHVFTLRDTVAIGGLHALPNTPGGLVASLLLPEGRQQLNSYDLRDPGAPTYRPLGSISHTNPSQTAPTEFGVTLDGKLIVHAPADDIWICSHNPASCTGDWIRQHPKGEGRDAHHSIAVHPVTGVIYISRGDDIACYARLTGARYEHPACSIYHEFFGTGAYQSRAYFTSLCFSSTGDMLFFRLHDACTDQMDSTIWGCDPVTWQPRAQISTEVFYALGLPKPPSGRCWDPTALAVLKNGNLAIAMSAPGHGQAAIGIVDPSTYRGTPVRFWRLAGRAWITGMTVLPHTGQLVVADSSNRQLVIYAC